MKAEEKNGKNTKEKNIKLNKHLLFRMYVIRSLGMC